MKNKPTVLSTLSPHRPIVPNVTADARQRKTKCATANAVGQSDDDDNFFVTPCTAAKLPVYCNIGGKHLRHTDKVQFDLASHRLFVPRHRTSYTHPRSLDTAAVKYLRSACHELH